MIKKLALLLAGILAGMAVMYSVLKSKKDELDDPVPMAVEESVAPEAPQFDLGPLYDRLSEEQQGKKNEKYWFEQQVDDLDKDAKDRLKRMQSQGDEAAQLFEQFTRTQKESESKN